MAKGRLHSIYEKALKQAGYNLTGRERTGTLKKRWQEYRSQYAQETGTTAPSVYEQAKTYDQLQAPTIDFGQEYLEWFVNKLDTIYRDTLAYIDNNKEGTHKTGKLASIASYHIDELAHKYQSILDELRTYIESGVPKEVIAQAIADNVELDYTLAVALQPPSDIVFLFDETLEQLQGIWSQINERVQELQEQMEAEYYGQ